MEQIEIIRLSIDDFKEIITDVLKLHLETKDDAIPDPLLTRRQVIDRLCISASTLHEYVQRRILRSYKIGNRVYFKWSEILNSAKEVEVHRKETF